MNRGTYIFLAITLVIVGILVLPRLNAIAAPEQPQRFSLHVVRDGEKLGELSRKYMPEVEIRAGIGMIKHVNGMSDRDTIQPGDLINVPDEDGELEEPLGPVYSSAKIAQEVSKEAERVAREAQQSASRSGQQREKADIYEAALRKIASGDMRFTWSMTEAAQEALAQVSETEG
ncbi:MAG: hypothetical protein ACYCX4_14375 [Bacillota bacterium]